MGSLGYSFKGRRPFTGQEELLARCGFPISRLNVYEGKALGSLYIVQGVPIYNVCACLCRQITTTCVAPSAWAIVLLVPPLPQGIPGHYRRHKCGREWQSLLFAQRPPPTHWSRRAHCQMRLSDSSPEASCIQRFRTFAQRPIEAHIIQ